MTKRHIGWSSFPRSKEVQGNKRHQKRQIIKQRQAIFRVCMLCHAMPSLALRSWQATKTGASQVQDSAWEGSSSGGLAHKMQNDANVQEVPPKRKSQVYKMSADIHSSCTHVVPRCTMLYHSAHRTRFVTRSIVFVFFFYRFDSFCGCDGPGGPSQAKPRSSAWPERCTQLHEKEMSGDAGGAADLWDHTFYGGPPIHVRSRQILICISNN